MFPEIFSSAHPAKVLVVEDDLPVRQHFERAINRQPQLMLAGSVGTCCEARLLLEEKPDVLLVDIGLPDGSGISLIRQLKALHPEGEALVVSVFTEEAKVVEAIRAGASGYLLKDTHLDEIGEIINDVLQGASPVSASIARYLLKALKTDTPPEQTEESTNTRLNSREIEILQLSARGYSRKEIAKTLGLSTHTVVTYIRSVYKKLEVHSNGEAVYEACQKGLIKLHD